MTQDERKEKISGILQSYANLSLNPGLQMLSCSFSIVQNLRTSLRMYVMEKGKLYLKTCFCKVIMLAAENISPCGKAESALQNSNTLISKICL